MQNKLILQGYIHFKTIFLFFNLSMHFRNTTKEFLQLLENISNNPLPPSHPKKRVVNVCKHKFACTNMTPKRRNGAQFITHALHCAWVMITNLLRLKAISVHVRRHPTVNTVFDTRYISSSNLFSWSVARQLIWRKQLKKNYQLLKVVRSWLSSKKFTFEDKNRNPEKSMSHLEK